MNLRTFLDMSGYGAYVWSCYALTLAVLVGNAWVARRGLAEAILRARRRLQAKSTEST
jgi:heme exporter protein CcmD